jgi:hypothetical protein
MEKLENTPADTDLLKSAPNQAKPTGRKLIAFVIGLNFPPTPGYSGVSVSAWHLADSDTGEIISQGAIASRQANRREWLASVMGVQRVSELALRGEQIDVWVRQAALEGAFANGFISADGKPMQDAASGKETLAQIAAKGQNVTVRFAPDSSIFRTLRKIATAAGKRRLGELPNGGLDSSQPPNKPSGSK